MANWNDRRGHRGHGRDDGREDIHQGPWSPYNGRTRDDERDTWGARGRDYWIEDDRWEDRRMGMGDQWRRREDDQEQDDNDQLWGNRMGLREEPSERSVPRSGAWQHEPRYGEMERMWSDRDDHPWPNERRATDEERREHRDYTHSRYSSRERSDDYARERGGEQYPRHAHQDWRDDSNRGWRDEEPRYWTDRSERDRGEPQRSRQNQRLLEGREQQRLLDEERFGGAEPSWVERTYQRGYDGRAHGGNDARYTRDDRGRVMGRDMRGRDDRDTRGRDDRDRDMQRRDVRGREHHEMRGGDMRGREHHEMRGGDMRGRDDRDTQRRDMHGRDERMHGDDRDLQRRDDRDLQRRDDRHPDQRRDDQGRGGPPADDRSGAHFGGQRRDRNRYD